MFTTFWKTRWEYFRSGTRLNRGAMASNSQTLGFFLKFYVNSCPYSYPFKEAYGRICALNGASTRKERFPPGAST